MKKYVKTNLKGSSQTRWSAKHVAVCALLNNLPEIPEALEEVKQTSRTPEAKYEAGNLLTAIKDFKYILNLTIWLNILREINRVNIEIQKEDIILTRSIALMDGLLKTLQNMRQKPMECWIKEAEEVAKKMVLTLFCKTNEFRNVKNILTRCVTTNYKHSNLYNYFLKK